MTALEYMTASGYMTGLKTRQGTEAELIEQSLSPSQTAGISTGVTCMQSVMVPRSEMRIARAESCHSASQEKADLGGRCAFGGLGGGCRFMSIDLGG